MNRIDLGVAQERILVGIADEQDYRAVASARRKESGHVFHIVFLIAVAAMFFL